MMPVIFQAIFVARLNSCAAIMELRRVQTLLPSADRKEVISRNKNLPRTERWILFSGGARTQATKCDVWFRYGNDSPWILKGAVNLRIEAGESVRSPALPVAGVLTTLMEPARGLLPATRGEVLINGCDLDDDFVESITHMSWG